MSKTDTFTEDELRSNPQDKEILENAPKMDNGQIDVKNLTIDQQAAYWRDKATASIRGHHDYRNKTEREMDILRKNGIQTTEPNNPEPINDLDFGIPNTDPSHKVLARVIEIAEDRAFRRMQKDPALVRSLAAGNQSMLEQSFNELAKEEGYESVLDYKDEIIAKHFSDPMNIPDNVNDILKIVAGGVLYEHRSEIDLKSKPKHIPMDMMGGQGGDKKIAPSRSLEYWQRMANENPKEFAKPENQKQFNEDMSK